MEQAIDAASSAMMTMEVEEAHSVIEAVCWGTRGSIASPGPSTTKYGGNTPCMQVRLDDGRRFIFDAGTGIRPLGANMMGEDGPSDAIIFLTHFHWDHIQGFPFFSPLYNPAASLRIIGPKQFDVDIQTLFAGQMGPIYFPIPFDALAAHKEFSHLNDGVWEEDGFTVSAMRMRHPSFTVGYRIEYGGEALAYIPDNEIVGEDYDMGETWRRDFIDFIGDVDVLIHDAMFTEEEYRSKVGWGHSSFRQAIHLAHEAGAKKLLFFHHDPERHDDMLSELVSSRRDEALSLGYSFQIDAAAERADILL